MSNFDRIIKQAVASWSWRVSARMRRPGCLVLMYHRIGQKGDPFPHLDVDKFRRQIEWVASNCRVIEPAELRASVERHSHKRQPILITFDDGTRDYFDLAYPVLRQLGVPAVVFPITDYIDRPRLTWFDRLHLAVRGARLGHVSLPWQPGRTVPIGGLRNDRFIFECKRFLKGVADNLKERLLDELVLALGNPEPPDVGRQFMNWDEIRRTLDLTTYGGHTHTHPIVSKVDCIRLEHEIRTCRERITAETGIAPTLFAYPNGDSTPEAKRLLADHGFEVAFSTEEGLADQTTDWLDVPRVGVGNIVPTKWMMTKSWTLFHSPLSEVAA